MVRSKTGAFTLVEVLIVVVVMAILAAVVVPQLTESTVDAKRSTAEFNLSTLRSSIMAYALHHHETVPKLVSSSLPGLTSKTRPDGTADPSGPYGPYVSEIPENPFTGNTVVRATSKTKSTITPADVTAGDAGGWLYNTTTGEVFLDSDPGFDF